MENQGNNYLLLVICIAGALPEYERKRKKKGGGGDIKHGFALASNRSGRYGYLFILLILILILIFDSWGRKALSAEPTVTRQGRLF